jgi:hypothetical protein
MSFEGANPFADQTGLGHDATAQDVTMVPRTATNMVAGMAATSTMHVAESMDLDLAGDFAIDMWIAPSAISKGLRYWLLDNNKQYFMSFGDTRQVRCGIGGKVVDAVQPIDASWHHVTCNYEANGGHLQVYVDGTLSGCSGGAIAPAPTSGHDGLAIGANLSGTTFSERYVGQLDNVHVYARKLGAQEICTAAGHTSCNNVCPGIGGGWPGGGFGGFGGGF